MGLVYHVRAGEKATRREARGAWLRCTPQADLPHLAKRPAVGVLDEAHLKVPNATPASPPRVEQLLGRLGRAGVARAHHEERGRGPIEDKLLGGDVAWQVGRGRLGGGREERRGMQEALGEMIEDDGLELGDALPREHLPRTIHRAPSRRAGCV